MVKPAKKLKSLVPLTQDLNWIETIFWASYVRSIYVLYLGNCIETILSNSKEQKKIGKTQKQSSPNTLAYK